MPGSATLRLTGQPGNPALVLGLADLPPGRLSLRGRAGGARGALALGFVPPSFPGALAGRTAGARGAVALGFDPNLLMHVGATRAARWAVGTSLAAGPADQWQPAAPAHGTLRPAWRAAPLAAAVGRERWHQSPLLPGNRGHIRWGVASPQRGSARAHWVQAPPACTGVTQSWATGTRSGGGAVAAWVDLPLAVRAWRSAWAPGASAQQTLRAPWRAGARLAVCLIERWRDAALVGYVWGDQPPAPPWQPPRPAPSARLFLDWPRAGGRLYLGRRAAPGAYRFPTRRSYYVNHEFAAWRLADSARVGLLTFDVSLDADAWAWSWSGTLAGPAALETVQAGSDGAPVPLAVQVNDTLWWLRVEDWEAEGQAGSNTIRVSGRGLSAELSSPEELPAWGVLQQARTLAQAFTERLPLGSPWTLAWAAGTPDWLLPAGAWTWSNQTPIGAIHAAALSVGLIVVPEPGARRLTIQPRYPVLPWALAAATPDLSVPASAIWMRRTRQRLTTQATAVWVQGGDIGGLLGRVWREGSAGDKTAAPVQCDLVTHVDAARLLGARLLAAQAPQPLVRAVRLPLGGGLGLVRVGSVVEIATAGGTERGIVCGVAVTANQSEASQVVSLGEDTPNQWAAWRRLTPASPLLAGTVASVGAGTCVVGVPGQGSMRLRYRGEPAPGVGTRVWCQDGWVQGAAPAMPEVDIAV